MELIFSPHLCKKTIKMETIYINSIPRGETEEEIKARKRIIIDFYYHWQQNNPSKRLYNRNLRDYINVRRISVNETAAHASKRYLSTLAVLQLDAILSCAKKIKQVRAKDNSNQSDFQGIIVMRHVCPGIGAVKLTVGIKQKSLLKIQYCITALEVEQ